MTGVEIVYFGGGKLEAILHLMPEAEGRRTAPILGSTPVEGPTEHVETMPPVLST